MWLVCQNDWLLQIIIIFHLAFKCINLKNLLVQIWMPKYNSHPSAYILCHFKFLNLKWIREESAKSSSGLILSLQIVIYISKNSLDTLLCKHNNQCSIHSLSQSHSPPFAPTHQFYRPFQDIFTSFTYSLVIKPECSTHSEWMEVIATILFMFCIGFFIHF